MQVLVVDDRVEVLETIREVLVADGHEVELAVDGAEALRAARRSPPAVILLDILMPGQDGFSFLAEKNRTPDLAPIPVVVVTAHARIPAQVQGVAAVLRKPFEAEELVRVVRGAAAVRR